MIPIKPKSKNPAIPTVAMGKLIYPQTSHLNRSHSVPHSKDESSLSLLPSQEHVSPCEYTQNEVIVDTSPNRLAEALVENNDAPDDGDINDKKITFDSPSFRSLLARCLKPDKPTENTQIRNAEAPEIVQVQENIETDPYDIWVTQITFTLNPKEDISQGIHLRLLAFLPTVIAKTKGNILPWDSQSDLNPVRDLYTICDPNILPKYFHYQMTQDRQIRGRIRIEVLDHTVSFNYLKYNVDIIKQALSTYPIYWTYTALHTTDVVSPLILVGISKTINLRQLKNDIVSHTGITCPVDIHYRYHVAEGIAPSDHLTMTKTKIRVQVIRVTCAKEDAETVKEKFFSTLGTGAHFSADHLYSSLPSIKVVPTRIGGAWTEQKFYQALQYQQTFLDTSVSLEVHHITTLRQQFYSTTKFRV